MTEVARETKDKAVIGLVMVSDRELVRTFNIRRIPEIYIVRNNQISAKYTGVVPREKIMQELKRLGG